MAPWDHTVENHLEFKEKTAERYFDHIEPDVVQSMLDRGLRELLGMAGATRAAQSQSAASTR